MIVLDLSILNQKGTPMFYSDVFANRPNFGVVGRIFISTDTAQIYRDTGTSWVLISDAGAGSSNFQQVTDNGATTTNAITTGGLTATNLAGGGSQMVIVNNAGTFSTQALPVDINIYNSDGTLSAARTLNTAGHNLRFEGGANTLRFRLSANNNIPRIFSFATADVARWAFRVDGNETGSNAGADLSIRRYNDAGTFIDSPLSINRSTGVITLLGTTLIGTTNNVFGQLQVDGTAAGGGIRVITSNPIAAFTMANSSSSNKEWDFTLFNNDLVINESNVNPSIILKAGGNIQLYRYNTNGFLKTINSDGTLSVDTTTYVPTITTITINGTALDLSTSRSWSVGTITGSGTTNYISKFTSSSALGISQLYDDGTSVAVGSNNPSGLGSQKFVVLGSAASQISRFTDGTNGDLVIDFPSTGVTRLTAQYGLVGDFVFAKGTGSTETMRITSSKSTLLLNQSAIASYTNNIGTINSGGGTTTITINQIAGETQVVYQYSIIGLSQFGGVPNSGYENGIIVFFANGVQSGANRSSTQSSGLFTIAVAATAGGSFTITLTNNTPYNVTNTIMRLIKTNFTGAD